MTRIRKLETSRFESVSELEEYRDNKIGSTIDLGSYYGKSLSWTKVGNYLGKSLYLCDSILGKRVFDNKINDYDLSKIRKWLLLQFSSIFTEDEQEILGKHLYLGDKIFLLSKEEFNDYKGNISHISSPWWLRSPGDNTISALYVFGAEGLNPSSSYVFDSYIGVRPAILM